MVGSIRPSQPQHQTTSVSNTPAPQAPAAQTPTTTPQAPTSAPADTARQPTATAQSSNEALAARSHDVGASMLSAKINNATAERELGPVDHKKKLDLNDPAARVELMRSTSQINPVSKKAGNGGLICGGASAANALIASGKTPEQRTANAEAVEKTAKNLHVPLSADEQKALQAMKDGKMSPTDAAHLQQAMYRMGKAAGVPDGGDPDGIGPRQMFALAGHLKAQGAFQGCDVKFHCNKTDIDGQKTNHWTMSVDGQWANSMNPSAKNQQYGIVWGENRGVSERNQNWEAEVSVSDDKVRGDYKAGDTPDKHYRLEADVNKMRSMHPSESQDGKVSLRGYLYEWQRTIEMERGDFKKYPLE